MVPFAPKSSRPIVILLLLRWFLPACIDRLFAWLLGFSLLWWPLLLLAIAITGVVSTSSSESARPSAIVPVSSSTLRCIAVLITILIEIRLTLIIEISSSPALLKIALLIIVAWVVVKTAITISTMRKGSKMGKFYSLNQVNGS